MTRAAVTDMSAISDVTKLDLLGERYDGGLDMGIVAEAPLDGSAETLALMEKKIRNYLREAADESFRARYGGIAADKIRILIESRFAVPRPIVDLVSRLEAEAADLGVRIEIRSYQ